MIRHRNDGSWTTCVSAQRVIDTTCETWGTRAGRHGPLTYSLRFEQYDENYQPNGASITPDRRTWDLRGGWRFEDGLRANARLQAFRDNIGSAVSLDTDTAGLILSGPIPFGLVVAVK